MKKKAFRISSVLCAVYPTALVRNHRDRSLEDNFKVAFLQFCRHALACDFLIVRPPGYLISWFESGIDTGYSGFFSAVSSVMLCTSTYKKMLRSATI